MNTTLEEISQESLKSHIQDILGKKITHFILKGKGAVNNAYYLETEDGKKYIVKQELVNKEFQPQNDLVVEGGLLKKLRETNLSTPVPNVIFISENPKLYGYEYIEGELMRGVWNSLSEEEKISICESLGKFHAEIGKNFTKEMSEESGVKINLSTDLHPEVAEIYNSFIADQDMSAEYKDLARKAKEIFEGTRNEVFFQFLHNDGHHENVIIKEKKISGIIDFGDAEYGEVAKEFSRYIRDYPDYFNYIVSAYEKESGNKLSYPRLVSNSFISDLAEIVENYKRGGDGCKKAENSFATYKRLLEEVTIK